MDLISEISLRTQQGRKGDRFMISNRISRGNRLCEMTAILPASNFYVPFGMEDQCLDDSFFTDGWENSSDELTFLCNPAEQDGFPAKERNLRGTKRARVEDEVVQNPQQGSETSNLTTTNSPFLNTSPDSQQQGKFLLQVSFEKLRRVEDPESSLRRSVLITNTLKLVHSELYGVKSPFGLTSAMSMNMDSHAMGNAPLPPSRKRARQFLNEGNSCPCRRKSDHGENTFTQDENNCERCTLTQVLNEDLEDDVFQSDNLHLENSKESSIFSELDSVFHSFVCALET